MAKSINMHYIDGQWAMVLANGDKVEYHAPKGTVFSGISISDESKLKLQKGSAGDDEITILVQNVVKDVNAYIDLTTEPAPSSDASPDDALTNTRSMLRLKP